MPDDELDAIELSLDGSVKSMRPTRGQLLRYARGAADIKRGAAQARDMRVVDPRFFGTRGDAAILCRADAVIINLTILQALVLPDRLLLLALSRDTHAFPMGLKHSVFKAGLKADAPEHFDLCAFELLFTFVSEFLSRQATKHAALVKKSADAAMNSLGSGTLFELRKALSQTTKLQSSVHTIFSALTSLDKKNLPKMCISSAPTTERVSRAEKVLEASLRRIEVTENELDLVAKDLDGVVELVALRLDAVRNALLRISVVVQSMTLGACLASLITNMFGMNLLSGLETIDGVFVTVTVICCFIAVIVTTFIFWYFRRSGIL